MENLELLPQELTSVIEALRDGILRRLRWCTSPQFTIWRQLDIKTVQTVMDSMLSAYTKAMMQYREGDFLKAEQFDEAYSMSDEMWEMLSKVTIAETWDDVPLHEHHNLGKCTICDAINGIA